jgi:hypothetical protein
MKNVQNLVSIYLYIWLYDSNKLHNKNIKQYIYINNIKHL